MSTLRKEFSVRYDGDKSQTYVMKFIVADLKLLNKMVQNANSDEEILLSDSLQEKQPGFYEEIEDVRVDPRCLDAFRFCTLFCSLALDSAERVTGECLPSFPKSVFHDMACMVAQRDYRLGKRARTYPDRIQRHVLNYNDFDDEDSGWLRTIISAFLVTLEKSCISYTHDKDA